MVHAYSTEQHAKEQEQIQQRQAMENSTMLWNDGQKVAEFKAHGFYLVHESLFDELLKKHNKD